MVVAALGPSLWVRLDTTLPPAFAGAPAWLTKYAGDPIYVGVDTPHTYPWDAPYFGGTVYFGYAVQKTALPAAVPVQVRVPTVDTGLPSVGSSAEVDVEHGEPPLPAVVLRVGPTEAEDAALVPVSRKCNWLTRLFGGR